ncbi:MAG: hypothetical protein ACFFCY_01300 [Promethearchaeota archaeon]
MRNPRILSFYFLFFILNLNLITQIKPVFSFEPDIIANSSNPDSWERLINPAHNIFYPNIKVLNESIYFAGQMERNYDYAIYIARFNESGEKLWENIWDTSYEDELQGFEFDSEQNLYILSLANTNSPGDRLEKIYLLKYSNSGELLWAKVIIQSRTCVGYSIKLDSNDFIYVAGYVWNQTTFYNFLLKLDSSGNVLWNQQLEWADLQLKIDLDNNIYIIGHKYPKFYLCKYNSSGSKPEWSLELGEIYYIYSMDFDSWGNIILKGITYNETTRSDKLWFMKYNNSGSYINKLEVLNISSDYYYVCRYWFIDDNVYVFINYPLSPDYFLLKYNSTFHICWNVSLNEYYITPYYYYMNIATTIGIDSQDNILFLYNNPRGKDTNQDDMKKYDSEDISILKLNSSGQVLSHYYWGGSYHDDPIQVVMDPQDNIYLLCTCRYVDIWNVPRDRLVLVKNPEINGIPPQFWFTDINSYYIFSLMSVMSVISLFLLISIIRPKRSYRKGN